MPFNTLLELLDALRSQPETYLGEHSLCRLDSFLVNFPVADDPDGRNIWSEFSAWASERVTGRFNNTAPWWHWVYLHAGSDHAGFHAFWDLWDEFLVDRHWPDQRLATLSPLMIEHAARPSVDVFDLLTDIRNRPQMYFFKPVVAALWAMMKGHRRRLSELGLWAGQGSVYDGFDAWLKERHALESTRLDWAQVMGSMAGSGPLERFWPEWDAYIAELRVWSRRSEYHSLLGAVAGGLLPIDEGQATLHSLWKADHDTTTVPPGLCESASPSSRTFYEEVGWLSSKPLAAIDWLTIEDFAKALSRIDRPAAERRRESNTEDM